MPTMCRMMDDPPPQRVIDAAAKALHAKYGPHDNLDGWMLRRVDAELVLRAGFAAGGKPSPGAEDDASG